MKAYSGSTSEGFLPASLPGAAPATAVAPAPEDPSATFSDFLQEQQGGAGPATSLPADTTWSDLSKGSESEVPAFTAPWASGSTAVSLASSTTLTSTLAAATASASTPAASFFDTGTASLNWPRLPAAATTNPPGGNAPLSKYAWSAQETGATTTTPPVIGPVNPTATQNKNASSFTEDGTPAPLIPASPTKPGTASVFSLPLSTSEDESAAVETTSAPVSTSTAAPPDNALASFMASQGAQPPLPTPPPAIANPAAANVTPDTPTPESAACADASPASESAFTLPSLSLPHYSWRGAQVAAAPRGATTPAVDHANTTGTTAGLSPSVSVPASPVSFALARPSTMGTARKQAESKPSATDPTTAPLPSAADATTFSTSPLALLLANASSPAATMRPQAVVATTGVTQAAVTSTLASSAAGFSAMAPSVQRAGKAADGAVSAEKKSSVRPVERSFIQSAASAFAATDPTSSFVANPSAATSQVPVDQKITSGHSGAGKSPIGAVSGALTSAGTVNGKKEVDMNATLERPDLVVSSGTNPLVTKTSADVHILLGTNNDFHEAIEQVMHVADLSNLSRTSNPLRVAIEIQTPPGAIVNVYVSRQADSSYRAQLSTNDPQALSWVQDQVGSLKNSTGTGTDIRWAPAQLETGTTAANAGSSSNGNNLDWNRGGNQGGNEPSDERPTRHRSNSAPDEDDAELGIPFLETLGAIGSAA